MADAQVTLALDIGTKRIGVAICDSISRLPKPLSTLDVDDKIFDKIAKTVNHEKAVQLVVGLPRNLAGNPTDQTRIVQAFAADLREKISIPVYFTDEAVTSVQAETELKAMGKPYKKSDIDALAAVFILEDFINAHQTIS